MAYACTDSGGLNAIPYNNFIPVLSANGTIATWLKPSWSSGDGNTHAIWHLGGTNDTPSWQKFSDNNNYVGFTNNANSRVVFADTGLYTSGTWYHLVFTWGSQQQVFINAVSKGTQSISFLRPTAGALRIGGYASGTDPLSSVGTYADWTYWNRVLSQAEIVALTKGISPLTMPWGLVAYIPFKTDYRMYGQLSMANNFASLTSPSVSFTAGAIVADPPKLVRQSWTKFWPGIDALGWIIKVVPPTIKFRRTLSPVGTRIGARQIQGWSQ
jgi:hypothetical protein